MTETKKPIVLFQAFQSAPDISFWGVLGKLKLESFQLNDEEQKITGYFEQIQHQDIPCRSCVDHTAFQVEQPQPTATVQEWRYPGVLRNTNTMEAFKLLDKKKLLDSAGAEILSFVMTPPPAEDMKDLSMLNRFILCTFADLKKHSYVYWFGFPALVPSQPFTLHRPVQKITGEVMTLEAQECLVSTFVSRGSPAFFLIKAGSGEVCHWSHWTTTFTCEDQMTCHFGFVDPCGLAEHPGWPLRNYLVWIAAQLSSQSRDRVTLSIVSFREHVRLENPTLTKSLLFTIDNASRGNASASLLANFKVTGWEPNARGKMGPRQINLSSIMDPVHLAEASADLNLKLMRWRQLPELQTGLLHSTRVLILGAGTLGCNIARICLGWGMRKFTFVDQSTVSPSNPVRQPLFNFEDVKKPKAEAAAAAIRRIFPGAETEGVELTIPMPGHPISLEIKKDFDRLQELMASHDVIFLGTDSRESRWLPTVMGVALKTKIVLNVALGFDTFLVMRHGVGTTEEESHAESPSNLGCYFCNDVVAPENSLRDRTLDQMCTVTRPGLAPAAAALAVELTVALLHHPQKHLAPAYTPPRTSNNGNGSYHSERTESTFGVLPHQIRGFLTHFGTVLPKTCAFHQCTACSPKIIHEYEEHGFDFLTRVCASPAVLEQVTGLDQLRQQVDDIDFDIDLEFDED